MLKVSPPMLVHASPVAVPIRLVLFTSSLWYFGAPKKSSRFLLLIKTSLIFFSRVGTAQGKIGRWRTPQKHVGSPHDQI